MNSRLAWLAPVLTAGLVAAMLVLSWRSNDPDGAAVLFGLTFTAYAVVGALIATRHPRNPVGWLFCAAGLLSAASEGLHSYAVNPAGRPGSEIAAWVSAWAGGPGAVTIVLILLLFPTGQFQSRAWRVVGLVAIAHAVLWALAAALDPGPLRSTSTVTNPVGISAAEDVLGPFADVAGTVFWVLPLAAVISVVVRFRAAQAVERAQIKWLAMAACLAVTAILAMFPLGLVIDTDHGLGDLLGAVLVCAAIASFPVAAGFAILRDRLYDIDVVVNRALVYGALTTTLVVTYLVLVLGLRTVLAPLTGDSDLAVAGSTLAVAALFRPLRSRIQTVVDRRFYRRRYDAARTLELFATRLRDRIDLEALDADLRRVVTDTMAPTHVSLWLREAGR